MLQRPAWLGQTELTLKIFFEGQEIPARPGDTVAVALLAAGIAATRTTPVTGSARGPFCMMGACFECLAVVDGCPNVQTCMTAVRYGMRVQPQLGPRTITIDSVMDRTPERC
jgi:D-hydroxyproline dehydrogenase subunit gamma